MAVGSGQGGAHVAKLTFQCKFNYFHLSPYPNFFTIQIQCQVAPVAGTFSSFLAVRTPEILQQIIMEPAAKNGGRQWPRRSSRRETENIQISILFQKQNK